MTYKIGVGILLEDELHNQVREIQLRIADVTGNWQGLCQPPHITVKRPFEVASLHGLEHYSESITKATAELKPFEVKLATFGDFGGETLFVRAEAKSEELSDVHRHLVSIAGAANTTDQFEGDVMVFHSTIARGLTKSQFDAAQHELKDIKLSANFTVKRLGLLLDTGKGMHWAVIREWNL